MEALSYSLLSLIIFVSLLFSAFFSGMEIAFVSANKLSIELEKEQGKFYGKVLAGFQKYASLFIVSMLVGNNISIVIYGIAAGQLIVSILFEGASEGYTVVLVQTVISTLLVLFTAEFLPKNISRINPNSILKISWPFILLFIIILLPVSIITLLLSEGGFLIFNKGKFEKKEQVFSKIDLNNFIEDIKDRAEKEEDLDHEFHILQNALQFSGIKVRDCMIPRTDIQALEMNDSIDEAVDIFINTGLSKLLIYKDTLDHVIGYIHSSEIFKRPELIKEIIRPVFVIPETMHAKDVMTLFLKKKRSLALVVDEYGGTSGILTIEDVIEEIFGEIEDEHDSDENIEKKVSDNEYIFSARLEISYLNKEYDLSIPEDDKYDTLGGWIVNNMERIPEVNELLEIDGYVVKMLDVHQNKINTIQISNIMD